MLPLPNVVAFLAETTNLKTELEPELKIMCSHSQEGASSDSCLTFKMQIL